MNYLGNALKQQKLKQAQKHRHMWELLESFLFGVLVGLCTAFFGMEYVVKFFN